MITVKSPAFARPPPPPPRQRLNIDRCITGVHSIYRKDQLVKLGIYSTYPPLQGQNPSLTTPESSMIKNPL